VSHDFWQQGGIGAALLAQHWDRFWPVTGHAVSAPCVSQQAFAAAQQRVLVAQQFGCAGLSALKAATERRRAKTAPDSSRTIFCSFLSPGASARASQTE
jgi:hypothetical protein